MPLLAVLFFLVLLAIGTRTVLAITSVAQTYNSPDSLTLGSIVSLQKDSTDEVTAANSNNVDSLFGVVITPDDSLLTLTTGGKNQINIATSGMVAILVSDINGAITTGDHITASPISGIGMKANTNVRVIGTAQGNLDTQNATKQTYKETNGTEHEASIGAIPVLVNVSYYFKQPDKTIIPAALQNIANSLAGKPVSTMPIIISAAIFVVTIIVVVSIIYSIVRNGIISVGRNPMAQSAVYRNVIQMSALVLGILAVGVVAIYLILTKM